LDDFLALAWRPLYFAFVIAGAALVAVSLWNMSGPPSPYTDPASFWPFLGGGLFVMLLPLLIILAGLYANVGTRTLRTPCQMDISADGYQVQAGRATSWTAWDSFKSARRVRQIIVLRVKGSPHEVCLPTRGFSPDQLVVLKTLLLQHRLDPD
jgi:hypothetical protein